VVKDPTTDREVFSSLSLSEKQRFPIPTSILAKSVFMHFLYKNGNRVQWESTGLQAERYPHLTTDDFSFCRSLSFGLVACFSKK